MNEELLAIETRPYKIPQPSYEFTLEDRQNAQTGLLSVVDFSLASTLSGRASLGVEYSAYPNIAAWLTRIEARDSWKKSAQSS